MKILVDENIPKITVKNLFELDHDVLDVRGTAMEGASDEDLWQMAIDQRRLLVSTDRGFAKKRGTSHFGIVIISLRQPNAAAIHERVLTALASTPSTDWPGKLVICRDATISMWRND